MADMEQLYTALRNADAAGDTAGAQKLAAYIQSQRSAAPTTPTPQEEPSRFGSTLKNLFGRDASQAGRVPASEYATSVGTGAALGGAIGAFGGPVGAAIGAGVGGLGGLLESGAKDLGFGRGTQMAAGMIGPAGIEKGLMKAAPNAIPALAQGVGTLAKDIAESKAAALLKTLGEKTMLGKMYYPAKYVAQKVEQNRKVNLGDFEKAVGTKAESKVAQGSVENVTNARAEIAAQHGVQGAKPESVLYENAKAAYDQALRSESFLKSPEFQQLTGGNKALGTKYSKVFLNEKGQHEVGQDVMENMKSFVKDNMKKDPKGTAALQDQFNAWMKRTTGKAYEQEARQAAEKVFVATAKDELPSLLANAGKESAAAATARTELRNQIRNLSKTPENQKLFFAELGNAMRDMKVTDSKVLWARIGPKVHEHMIKDRATYDQVTRIMSGAKTPREVTRALRVMMATVPAGSVAAMNGDSE